MSPLLKAQTEFAADVRRLLQYAESQGFLYTFGEAERPIEMQRIHVQAGRSKTMNSRHLERLAIDLYFFTPEGKLLFGTPELSALGQYWEALSPLNRWGGNWKSFKDEPHFERQRG